MLTKPRSRLKIYDHDHQIAKTWDLIHKELSPENIAVIERYDIAMVGSALAKATRHKHLKMMLGLSRLLGKNWDDTNKEDIDVLVFKLMEKYSDDSGKETSTTWDYKKSLKVFFRWFRLGSREMKEVGDPYETKSIKIKKVKNTLAREDLLTEDELEKLLKACGENQRDRAFIDCHYEAGTRPGEILNLQLKHVTFDEYGGVLHVDGKTGTRTIRLINSVPNLASWMENHPFRDNPEAPLWPNFDQRANGKEMTIAAARRMLQRRCKKAVLQKRVFLNLFRHSEATRAANFMTEPQLRKRHGWSNESKMPAVYVHLVNSDVDAALFEHYGIKKKEDTKPKIPKKCHFCTTSNPSDGKLCSKCGKPLDLQEAMRIEEETKQDRALLLDEISRLRQSYENLSLEFRNFKTDYGLSTKRG